MGRLPSPLTMGEEQAAMVEQAAEAVESYV